MTTKKTLFIALAAAVLLATGVGYFALTRDGSAPTSGPVPDGSIAGGPPKSSATPAQDSTPTVVASATGSTRPSSSGDGAKDSVVGLVDARSRNDEAAARRYGSETAVKQIYSFPPFNPREATIACSEQGAKATCTLSAPAAGGSMILSLSRGGGGWVVDSIEPVID